MALVPKPTELSKDSLKLFEAIIREKNNDKSEKNQLFPRITESNNKTIFYPSK